MDWGKQELRQRTLCEARGCHNCSAPKEPCERSNRFGKRVRSFTGLSRTAPRFAKAVNLPNGCTLTALLLVWLLFLQSFFFQIKKKVESSGAEDSVRSSSVAYGATFPVVYGFTNFL